MEATVAGTLTPKGLSRRLFAARAQGADEFDGSAMARSLCLLAVGAALSLIAIAPALAADTPAALQAIIDGARKEGRLDINNGPGVLALPDGREKAEAELHRMFGVDIRISWTPAPSPSAQITKIYTEFRAGVPASTDLFTIAAPAIAPYMDKGMFRKVAWTQLMPGRITPDIVEGDGQALRLETQVPGILYNVKLAPWVEQVDTMQDLLKPEYKGKFATSPYLAGIDVLLSPEAWGVEKTTAYVEKFAQQVSGLIRCGGAEARVATGEFPAFALDCIGGDQNMLKFRGTNILDTKIVRDSAQRRYLYMVVPTRANHPNAAILYALYMASPEGQSMLVDHDGADLDSYPNSVMGKRVKAAQAKGVKFIDVSINWWAKQPPQSMKAISQVVKIVNQHH
jgi:ABC-type Fe3+ transport system substrate-binding protein